MTAILEHANITVTDAEKTARWIEDLFGWEIRWDGPSKEGGRSILVGTQNQYLALYQPARPLERGRSSYLTPGGLNHIAVVVDDIDNIEEKVAAVGFQPENHADYEPGRRFYFQDDNGIEYEIVQYD